MTVEDRLRELARDVRVEVRGDVAARAADRARARAVRHRAAFATAVVAAGGTAAAVAVAARAPEPRRHLTPVTPSGTPTATPAATPTASPPALTAAEAAVMVTACEAALAGATNGRESFGAGASVAVAAADETGVTALVGDGTRYRACHRHDGAVRVDGDWAYTDCEGDDVAVSPSAGRPLRSTDARPGAPARVSWVVYGCASERVARVEFAAKNGTTFGAVVANRVFVGRRDTGLRLPPATDSALYAYEDLTYRAYDAAGALVAFWPRAADAAALSERYERCVRAKGFDPDFVQVLMGEDAPEGVKTGRDVPARIHRPCFVAIGGADPHASSYGN